MALAVRHRPTNLHLNRASSSALIQVLAASSLRSSACMAARSRLIRHEPSGTLIGGYNGSVWIARVIIILILNFAAVNGDLQPPHDPPPGYDVTKLPPDELTHVLSWAREFIEALKASVAVLARTSHARRSYLEPAAQPQDPVPGPIVDPPQSPATNATSPSAAASTPQPPPTLPSSAEPNERRRQKSKQPAKSKALQADKLDVDSREMSPTVSDESDAERNYDEMDGGSDDDSLNPAGFSFDPQPDPPSSPFMGRFAQLNVDLEDGAQNIDRSTLELQKEFGDLFNSDPRGLAHVFGPLLALPPSPRAPSFPTIAALSSGIETATANLESAIRGWHEVLKPNATALAGNIANAHRDSKAAPAPIQPLVYFLLARRCEWECAKLTAPIVIRLMPHLALHARAGLQLDAAVSEFWDVEDHAATVDDAEREAVDKLHRRMLKGVVEASWIYKELLAFEKLSTEWSSVLPGDWLTSDPLTLGHNLGQLVLQLADWADAAGKLDVHHLSLRKRMWLPTGRPFESKHRALLAYRFGSPYPQEVSDGLKAVRAVTSVNPVPHTVPGASPPVKPSTTASTPNSVAPIVPNAPSPPVALVASTESPTALNGDNTGDNGSSIPSGPGNELPRTSSDNESLVATPPDAAVDAADNAAANVVPAVAVPAAVVPAADNAVANVVANIVADVAVSAANLPNQGSSRTSKKSKAAKVAATPRLTRNNAAAAAAAAAPTATAPVATGSAANVSSRTRRANIKSTGAGTSKKGTKNK
ncbi:hypothetical protein FRC12_019219 [Ceratobasidium sp. 428]|nr:hypothetical protein FRC12_019219 [Ceratobasidium sp. 428]